MFRLVRQARAYIETLLRKEDDHINRLDGTPGINRRVAEIIIAEAGTHMNRFPDEYHFASWIGLSSGQNQSAGKRKSAKTRKGNRALRAALVEAAHCLQGSHESAGGELVRAGK